MSFLEWVGVISIIVYCARWSWNVYKIRYPETFTEDPAYSKRQYEFNRMNEAFEKLRELRDMKYTGYNESIANVQGAIDALVQGTVVMPKDSYASDYRSKYVDYTVVYYLASNIINSSLSGKLPAEKELKVKW